MFSENRKKTGKPEKTPVTVKTVLKPENVFFSVFAKPEKKNGFVKTGKKPVKTVFYYTKVRTYVRTYVRMYVRTSTGTCLRSNLFSGGSPHLVAQLEASGFP